jgi:uncharacterized protein YdiU (UPF0061 family)
VGECAVSVEPVSLATESLFAFDDSFARELDGLYEPWQPTPVPDPSLVILNDSLAVELGLDPDALRRPAGIAVLAGNSTPDGSSPIAQAYAGHQFGGFSPRLGDGRALLLGEVLDRHGNRHDVHLKGSGRTPFARGGDGKAVLGPMLREYLIGEAMHALGVPTTRGLAVVTTGEQIARDRIEPGAVLTRVASSLLRVGTFQYAAVVGGPPLVRRLADYAAARHGLGAPDGRLDSGLADPYRAFFEAVVEQQASLVARWMLVGFVHGVMNTDNMAISGETIDYGPCAFVDAYDPAAVFSSIDHGGRYAYGNQPRIAQWNLARLAETLVPLFARADEGTVTDAAIADATEVLSSFDDRYRRAYDRGMRAKLGLADVDGDVSALTSELLGLLAAQRVDLTSFFRTLSSTVRGDAAPARALFADPDPFDEWSRRWRAQLAAGGRDPDAVAADMDRANPVYIPRNHLVEEALQAATAGDLDPFERLLDVLARPFDERPGLERYARPAPPSFGRYRTFCGT